MIKTPIGKNNMKSKIGVQSEILKNILKEIAFIIDDHSKRIELLNDIVVKQNELINILYKEIIKEIK